MKKRISLLILTTFLFSNTFYTPLSVLAEEVVEQNIIMSEESETISVDTSSEIINDSVTKILDSAEAESESFNSEIEERSSILESEETSILQLEEEIDSEEKSIVSESSPANQEGNTILSREQEDAEEIVQTSVIVLNFEEFLAALSNSEIVEIKLGADIISSDSVKLEIYGDSKSIDGQNHSWTIESDENQYINFHMRVGSFSNISISSVGELTLNLMYGGEISNFISPNVFISSGGDLHVADTEFKGVTVQTEGEVSISNSKIFERGIFIADAVSTIIDNITVNADSYIDALIFSHIREAIVSNTTIDGGSIGLHLIGYQSRVILNNTSIVNSKNYGISNEPRNGYSTIEIEDVTIVNSGSYSINNEQKYSGIATIYIGPSKILTIKNQSNIGIFQKKGNLEIYGALVHEGNNYTIENDNLSSFNDSNGLLIKVHETEFSSYYNSSDRYGGDFNLESREVSNELELKEALENENIANISITSDIELTGNMTFISKGPIKIISGNEHVITNNEYTPIIFDSVLSLFDIVIESPNNSIMYINLNKGGLVQRVTGLNTSISSQATLSLNDSNLFSVSLRNADKSMINNSTITEGSLRITETEDFLVDHVTVNANSSTDAVFVYDAWGKLSNVNINSGNIGLYVIGESTDIILEKSRIQNTISYGIYNEPNNNWSTIYLNNVDLNNTGSYSIFNTQTETGIASIINIEDSNLQIFNENNIGIFQNKGYFENKGVINHSGNNYTLVNDSASSLVDSEGHLVLNNKSDFFSYYDSVNKIGTIIDMRTATVSSPSEFNEALQNPTISTITLENDIEFDGYQSVFSKGNSKNIHGNGYSLIVNDYYQLHLTHVASISNLKFKASNNSFFNIILDNGGFIEEVMGDSLKLTSNNKIKIFNSTLNSLYIFNGDDSLVDNLKVVNGNVMVSETNNILLKNIDVATQDNSSGIHLVYVIGHLLDAKVNGGYNGLYVYGKNSILLENVDIDNASNYGIHNKSASANSDLFLKNVTINNSGKTGIHNEKSSGWNAYITVKEDSTLSINDINQQAIIQKDAHFINYGNIEANNKYTISSDYNSSVEDYNNNLFLLNPYSQSNKFYILRSLYEDKTSPNLKLNGDEIILLTLGDVYSENGIEAYDDFDGEIFEYQVTGEVNINQVGTYTLSYSVSDTAGNVSTIERTVEVQPKNISDLTIEWITDTYIYTNSPISPDYILSHNGIKLIKGIDFEEVLVDNNQVGEGKIILTGINNYLGEVTYTFNIIPRKIESIKIYSGPDKTSYIVGDSLELEGLQVLATYNDKTTETLSYLDYIISGFNSTEPNEQQNITITIDDLETVFTIKIMPKELLGLEIKSPPTKVKYIEGQNLDLAGLEIQGFYNNGTKENINLADLAISGYDSETPEKDQPVTLEYQGQAATFTVDILPLELTRLEVVTLPKQTVYVVGQTFDSTGLALRGQYNDGKEREVMFSDVTVTGFDSSEPITGQQVVFHSGDHTAMVEVTIIPRELTGLEIASPPTKVSYIEGEGLDLGGLEVQGIYNDGTREAILPSELAISGYDSETPVKNQPVTLAYQGQAATFTVDILPLELTGLEVVTLPKQTVYVVGQTFDSTGLALRGQYNDGKEREVMFSDVTVTGFDSSEPITGQQVVFHSGDHTAMVEVTIIPRELTGLEIASPPTKVSYIEGEGLDLGGLEVQGIYNDGTREAISPSELAISGYDSETPVKNQPVTLAYQGQAATFTVDILPLELTGLEVVTLPKQTVYVVGQTFDSTGLTLGGQYNDGKEREVMFSDVTVTGFDSSEPTSSQQVVFQSGDHTAMVEVTIIPRELTGLEIASPPTKVSYIEGEGLDLGGLEVQGIYNDGTREAISPSELAISGYDSETPVKNQPVTLAYQGQAVTFTVDIFRHPAVFYRTHVQSDGWQPFVKDGAMSGTSGQAKRLEGIEIKLDNLPYAGGIEYQTHVQSYGWMNWSKDGAMSGTSGEAKRLEGIRIKLTGELAKHYDVYYRVHAESFGWLDWTKNGEASGTEGLAKRLEGIEVQLVKKGEKAPGATKRPYILTKPSVSYTTHVQKDGWQAYVKDGQMAGTSGRALRLEGIKMQVSDPTLTGGIEYRTHVQKIGWQDWKANDDMSGTSGQALRLEAIQIRLTGELAKHYDVYYRVHAQSYGWLGWAKSGESSGTEGLGKRLEGIEVRLVRKGGKAPGTVSRSFVKK